MPTTSNRTPDTPELLGDGANTPTAAVETTDASECSGVAVVAPKKKASWNPAAMGKPGVGKGNNQLGNRNAMRHGLSTGKLPPELQYVEIRCNEFRRILEDQLANSDNKIRQIDAATIWAVIKRFREVMLRERRMRFIEEGCAEWFTHVEQSATAAEKLVKLLDRLPLEHDSKTNVLNALYRILPPK
jgi:uncharacterized protein YjcR